MPDFTGVLAAGSSITRYISFCFERQPPIPGRNTSVILARTEDLNTEVVDTITPPALSLFLYRVDFNKTMRAAWSAVGHVDGESHLPLDLHFLLTAWADNAENEYRIVGRAMQCLENTPILTGPMLDPLTDWTTDEAVQVCLEDLTTEDVMRTFDSLPVDYKLSIPYVARVIVINGGEQHPSPPVARSTSRLKSGVDR